MADDDVVPGPPDLYDRFSPIKLGEDMMKVQVTSAARRKKLDREHKMKEKQDQERLAQRQQEQVYDRLLQSAALSMFSFENEEGEAAPPATTAEDEEEGVQEEEGGEEEEESCLFESVCISPPVVTVGVAARVGQVTYNTVENETAGKRVGTQINNQPATPSMLAMFASSPDPQDSMGRVSFSPGSTTPFYGRVMAEEPPGAVLDYGFGFQEDQLTVSPPRGDDLDSFEGAGVRSTPMSELTDYFTPPLTESPSLPIPLLPAPSPPMPVHAPPHYKRNDTSLVVLGDEEHEAAEKKLEYFLAKLTLSQGETAVKVGDGKLETVMARHRELVAKGIVV